MLRFTLLVVVLVGVFFTGAALAQDAAKKTNELVAALDKTKYKKKTKRIAPTTPSAEASATPPRAGGEPKTISIEVYVDIKNTAAVRANATDYSGVYKTDGHKLDLNVAKDGRAEGSGYDSINSDGPAVKFTLRDARIDGALLTGLRVYENGETRKLEAAFVNRTVSHGKNANDIESHETSFGLGFIESGPTVAGSTDRIGEWTNRVFLEKK